MAPSSAQVAFARDLGISDEVINNSNSGQLAGLIEQGNAERKRGGSRARRLHQPAAVPVSSRSHRCWSEMASYNAYLLSRGKTCYAAAVGAVENFDLRCQHVDCWPDEVRSMFDARAIDELRAELLNEYANELGTAAAG
jgi:hypothetical protein